MTEYVLIYNNEGVSPASRDDLETLFVENEIYPEVTVRFTDFKSNFDGLAPSETTIVLPGGVLSLMTRSLRDEKYKLHEFVSEGSNGVFVCAGAYLAVNTAEVFCDNVYGYSLPPERTLNIVPNYKAMGSFVPNTAYDSIDIPESFELIRPYAAALSFENSMTINQLYLGGCGFQQIEYTTTDTCEVVARYADNHSHTFFRAPEQLPEEITDMPAILRSRERGLFLSGTHIETCVEESKLLQDIQEVTAHEGVESVIEGYDAIESREALVPLLQETLTR